MSPRSMRTLAAVALAAGLVLSACTNDDRAEQAQAQQTPNAAPTPASIALARNVDTRNPKRLVATTPVVMPLRVPARADAGVPLTTSFSVTPNASCQLRIRYERDGEMTAFTPALADDKGVVSWKWTPQADAGDTAFALVVCSGGEQWTSEIAIE